MKNITNIYKYLTFDIYHLALICLLGSLLICLLPKKVLAQSASRSFTISPPSFYFTLKPGQKTERTIKVTNNSDQGVEFSANVLDFVVTDKSGTPELLPVGLKPDNQYSGAFWTAVLPDTLIVPARKTMSTTLYLNVPADARPGGRYFAVSFKPTNLGSLANSGAAVNPVIGSLVYLTVAGKITENSRIIKFSAPSFSEFGPISITTEIKNLGDVHASPRGVIEVKNLFGQKVFSTALANLNIFPGTSRVFTNTWEKKWLFGRFSANLTGYYGQANNLPLLASTTFWVIPLRLIVTLLLALAIGIAAYIFFKNRKEKEEIEK